MMMKKIFGLLAVIALISFTSCSTQCTCTISATGEGSEYFPTTTTTFEADGGNCSDGNSTTTSGGLTVTTACK